MLTQFFATRSDLLALFDYIEAEAPFKYVRMMNNVSPEPVVHLGGSSLPNLGIVESDALAQYLVVPNDRLFVPRMIQTKHGTRFAFDQLYNPDSVCCCPGGVTHECVLQGSIGTCSDTSVSKEMFHRYRNALKHLFSNVEGRFVGPQAREEWQRGTRLTLSVTSSPRFDLR